VHQQSASLLQPSTAQEQHSAAIGIQSQPDLFRQSQSAGQLGQMDRFDQFDRDDVMDD